MKAHSCPPRGSRAHPLPVPAVAGLRHRVKGRSRHAGDSPGRSRERRSRQPGREKQEALPVGRIAPAHGRGSLTLVLVPALVGVAALLG